MSGRQTGVEGGLLEALENELGADGDKLVLFSALLSIAIKAMTVSMGEGDRTVIELFAWKVRPPSQIQPASPATEIACRLCDMHEENAGQEEWECLQEIGLRTLQARCHADRLQTQWRDHNG